MIQICVIHFVENNKLKKSYAAYKWGQLARLVKKPAAKLLQIISPIQHIFRSNLNITFIKTRWVVKISKVKKKN